VKWRALYAVALVACDPQIENVLTLRSDAGIGEADATIDPNPSLCATAGLAFCDGFEGTELESPPWYFVRKVARLTIDDLHAYRGARAFHVSTEANADVAGVRQGEITETAAAPQPAFFARMFVYLPSPAPARPVRIAGLLQVDAPNEGPSLFLEGGQLVVTTAGSYTTSATALPLDRWTCLEWQVISGTNGEIHLWLDDVEVGDVAFSGDTTRSPPVGRFSLGAAFFGSPDPQPAFDFWFDEIALDPTRIGCER
jgi:hypothetical protein